jgi:catechol 2,3-dioxygenase-like lactoylglutathione lyase family enzyme
MIGHLSLGVGDLQRAMRFYDAALGALGYVRVWSSHKSAGYGVAGGNDRLALFAHPGQASPPGPGFHLAFCAPDRTAVDRFHQAALANGGRDCGPPGPRETYAPTYYASFVVDPDGYKLEAVHQ